MEHDGEMEALGETSSGALRTAIVAPRRCVAARRTATAGLAEARVITLRTDRAVGRTVRGTRRRARTARGGSPRRATVTDLVRPAHAMDKKKLG